MDYWVYFSDMVSLILLGAIVFLTGYWSSRTSKSISSEEYLFRCVVILVMCLEVKLSVLKGSWSENDQIFWAIQAAIFLCILTMAAFLYPLKTAAAAPLVESLPVCHPPYRTRRTRRKRRRQAKVSNSDVSLVYYSDTMASSSEGEEARHSQRTTTSIQPGCGDHAEVLLPGLVEMGRSFGTTATNPQRFAVVSTEMCECDRYGIGGQQSQGPRDDDGKNGAAIPFTLQDAMRAPCGVWQRKGDKEWRVVDRRQKTVNIRSRFDQGADKDQQGSFVDGAAGASTSKAEPASSPEQKPCATSPSFKNQSSLTGGIVDNDLMKIERDEYAHIRFRRHRGVSEGNGEQLAPTVHKEASSYEGGIGNEVEDSESEVEVTHTYSTKELDEASEEETVVAGGEYCAKARGLSKWMTFFSGVLLMFIGALCHYLVIHIDWDAVYVDILAYWVAIRASVERAVTSTVNTVSSGCSWIVSWTSTELPVSLKWFNIFVICLIIALLICLKCHAVEWDCRRQMKAASEKIFTRSVGSGGGGVVCTGGGGGGGGGTICTGGIRATGGETRGKYKEHYRVTYTVDLNEEDWQHFQKTHNKKTFRPVAPRLVSSIKL